MNEPDLLACVEETRSSIFQGDMDEAILLHYDLIMESYRRKPLFYKKLLKYDRFIVTLSLLSFMFADDRVPLSRVKAFCQARGYMSRNSLDTYFSFLLSAGYMQVRLHDEDERQRVFNLTDRAVCEVRQMIDSYVLPSQIVAPYERGLVGAGIPEDVVPSYFHGIARVLYANGTLDQRLPEARWMINRDGGHLPMLALYSDSLRNGPLKVGYKAATYVELSARLGVSKTHIIRMVKEGELRGYFKCRKHQVELLPAFIDLVRKIMAIYFSVARVSMELGMEYGSKRNRLCAAGSLSGE